MTTDNNIVESDPCPEPPLGRTPDFRASDDEIDSWVLDTHKLGDDDKADTAAMVRAALTGLGAVLLVILLVGALVLAVFSGIR